MINTIILWYYNFKYVKVKIANIIKHYNTLRKNYKFENIRILFYYIGGN